MKTKHAENLGYAVFLVILATFPLFWGRYYTFLAIIALIYVIIATGLNVLNGLAGLFSLGHAGLVAIGAYTTALVSKQLVNYDIFAKTGLNVITGIVAGMILSCIVGSLLAYPSLRTKGVYLGMVTISFGWIVWKILLEWIPVTGGELGISNIPRPRVGGIELGSTGMFYGVLFIAAVCFILQRNIMSTWLGRTFRAVKMSEHASAALGIHVHKSKVTAFVISAWFAGLGGALFAHQQNYINPDTFSFFDSVFYITAILMGGSGTLLGPVAGSIILTMLPELLHGFDMYRLIVYSVIIISTLYFVPRGIWGEIEAYRQRSRSKKPSDEAGNQVKDNPGLAELSRRIARNLARQAQGGDLVLKNLTKCFGGVTAVNAIETLVKKGTIHSIIGPNGAGKTTLLNCISGFYTPADGEIRYGGTVISGSGAARVARAGIARTFQNIQLFGEMTVMENVLTGFQQRMQTGLYGAVFNTKNCKDEEKRLREQALELLSFIGLHDLANDQASSLPYGNQRKLEIIRALAMSPSLLLLDEPAAGLHGLEVEEMEELIRAIAGGGVTVVLVEHHVELVMNISDIITVLDYGRKIAEGTPEAVRSNPKVIEAYLGVECAVEN